ncbi:MAG: L-2-amino-thiazoline-4-carboxylic acid hydrolase [Candidatus Methanomethylicia archaeon]
MVKKECVEQVEIAVKRIALLHIAYVKVLVKEFGEEKAKELSLKAIMEYGKLIGERIKRGLPDFPKYGASEKTEGNRVYGCKIAEVFLEYNMAKFGCIYCYVDPAKSMMVNPEKKVIHTSCILTGDGYCTFEICDTTTTEREAFKNGSIEWSKVDKKLYENIFTQINLQHTNEINITTLFLI